MWGDYNNEFLKELSSPIQDETRKKVATAVILHNKSLAVRWGYELAILRDVKCDYDKLHEAYFW